MAKRTKITTDASALTSNPFAQLSVDVPDAPERAESSSTAAETTPSTPSPPAPLRFGARVIVRRQKKGQGGKTVTCAEGLPPTTAQTLLPGLKRELGCGGRIDDDVLVLGTRDHQKVAQWLRDAGARNVKLGN